jgi:hypothetical protein
MRVETTTDLILQLPDSLLFRLESQARERGISTEVLCLSLLSGAEKSENYVDPAFYPVMGHDKVRQEIERLIESGLPKVEINKRVRILEMQLAKRFIR